jgi:Antirestriction protein (ArdA)
MDIGIFVVCKAARQKGIEYGKWCNAIQPVERLLTEVQALLQSSPVPKSTEWLIEDFSGFFELQLLPNIPLEKVVAMAMFIHKHQELAAKLLIHTQGDLGEAEHLLSDCFLGEYKTKEACVQDIFCSLNPDFTQPLYGASMAWDIFQMGGFSIKVERLLYVFHKHSQKKFKSLAGSKSSQGQ